MSFVTPSKILELAEKYRSDSIRIAADLIRIPSFSGRESAAARYLEKELAARNADEIQIDNLGNVIARIGSRGPVIAVDGHIDTVDIGRQSRWNKDPFSGDFQSGRVFGRGAADQKGGLAAMLTAMRILKDIGDDLPFTLFFVFSVQEEECEGICWQYIIKEDRIVPDIVILTEPTDGRINIGHRGRMEMEIVVEGISCHGSTPDLGENAIYKLNPIIAAIQKLNDSLPADPFLGKGSLTATRIRSVAPSLNAVPDLAALYIDRRLTGGETPDDARRQIESILDIQIAGARVEIPIYETPSWRGTTYPTSKIFPAWTIDSGHHLIDYAGKCHKGLFDQSPNTGKWSFSTNGVATMGLFGIPTFGFGPGEEKMAHASNESVAVDDIVRCAAFYAYFPWIVVGR